MTVNGDYTGGGTLLFDSELNGDDSVSDQLVMNGRYCWQHNCGG
ncbi:autotransporter outer membrane beta-barrel domain-containing protein [Escherichia coli]|nr:autotransporter outer membrane beta-barrel domain-containing protein [Escherichia coli]